LQSKWKYQFQFAGFIVAKEKGFYKELGYNVKLIEFNASKNNINDIKNQKIDFAVSDSSLVLERMKGASVVALMPIFQESPFVLLALKSSNIKTLQDINNKRISLHKNINGVAIKAMLKSNHINYYTQEATHTLDTIINKDSDVMTAYLSNEPIVAKEKGIEVVIFNPKEYGFAGYGDILFCSQEMIDKHPKIVQDFYNASRKGWEYAFSNIDEVVDLIYYRYNSLNKSKKALKDEAQVLKQLSGYGHNFGEFNKEKIKAISQMFNFMVKEKYNFDYLKNFIYNPKSTYNKKINFTEKELSYLKKKKTIKMCIDPNWMPLEKIVNGQAIGFTSDFIKLISDKVNTPIILLPTSTWSKSLSQIKDRNCDIIPMIASTPELKKDMDFTSSYITFPIVIATKRDTIYINDLKNQLDKKFAVVKNYALNDYLKSKYPALKIIAVNSIFEGLEKVTNNEVFGYIDNSEVIINEIQKNFFATIAITGKANWAMSYRIATRSDEPILNSILEKAISTIDENSKENIKNHWFKYHPKFFNNSELIKKIFLAFLIILIVGTSFLLILKRKNKKLGIAQKKIKEFNCTLKEQVEKEVKKNQTQQLLLLQQSRLAQMGEMLSMIAHQWRQPLSSINATILVMDMKVSKENIENKLFLDKEFNDIESLTKHMSKTIDDFKEFFKPGKEKVLINLKETIEETLNLIKPILKNSNINIVLNSQNHIKLLGYPNELGQVILNIISNAKDALLLDNQNEKKNIYINLFKEDKKVFISIQDNAGGIDLEIIKHIFDPYFSTKSKKNGTGLGLYIAKVIIEEHMNGKLNVRNKNNGALFQIELKIS